MSTTRRACRKTKKNTKNMMHPPLSDKMAAGDKETLLGKSLAVALVFDLAVARGTALLIRRYN